MEKAVLLRNKLKLFILLLLVLFLIKCTLISAHLNLHIIVAVFLVQFVRAKLELV